MSEKNLTPNSFIAPSPEELAPFFPAYEVEAFIAQGGMGAVYKANQISLDRPVAIKILPREFGADEQFRESFEAEAKAMARLNHPNLIGVYDFGNIEGMLYIIMEYVQGKALYYSIHNKAIDPQTALPLISKISRGLAHAHTGGILHRDIKPANILLDIDATPKIGDFGLARHLDNDRGEALTFGTPGYTAPEVYSRQHSVDQRSDIFSVAAMLYELVKGCPPAEGETAMNTGIDARLDAIIAKATALNPADRHADIDLFADELDTLVSLLSGPRLATSPHPTSSIPQGITGTTLKSAKSSSAPLLLFLGMFVAAAVGAFVFLKDRSTPPEDDSTTVEAAVTPTPEKTKPKKDKKNNPEETQGLKMVKKSSSEPTNPEMTNSDPEPAIQVAEKPMDSLDRLQDTLKAGKRNELPFGTIQKNGSAFFLYTDTADWNKAQELAEIYGASLVTIEDTETLEWLRTNLKPESTIWIGASDAGTENKWNWPNGTPLDSLLWAEGSPAKIDSDTRDYSALSPNGVVDLDGNSEFQAIFEWRLDGTNPGSIDAQMSRTASHLSQGISPVFPSSAITFESSRYLLIEKNILHAEAKLICEKAGAHLAVVSSQKEANFIAALLSEKLDKNQGFWLGAQRSTTIPNTWLNDTGETFEFITWRKNQPDFSQQTETVLEFGTDWQDTPLTGFNDSDPSQPNIGFLLEWSHPSVRNMPSEGSPQPQVDTYAPMLTKIRERILNKHGRTYQRYRSKKERIIQRFVDDSIDELERSRKLAPDLVGEGIEYLEGIEEAMELPEELPLGFGKRIQENFQEAKEDNTKFQNDYDIEHEQVKSNYLNLLSAIITNTNDAQAVEYFTAEASLIKKDSSRLGQILRGDPIPSPVAIENDFQPEMTLQEFRKQFIGKWESEGADDIKVSLALKPNGEATLFSHGGAQGTWKITEETGLVNFNGFKIKLSPGPNRLRARDANGNRYLLIRVE